MDLGSKLSYSNPNNETSIENTVSLSDMERLDLNNTNLVPIFQKSYNQMSPGLFKKWKK